MAWAKMAWAIAAWANMAWAKMAWAKMAWAKMTTILTKTSKLFPTWPEPTWLEPTWKTCEKCRKMPKNVIKTRKPKTLNPKRKTWVLNPKPWNRTLGVGPESKLRQKKNMSHFSGSPKGGLPPTRPSLRYGFVVLPAGRTHQVPMSGWKERTRQDHSLGGVAPEQVLPHWVLASSAPKCRKSRPPTPRQAIRGRPSRLQDFM